MASCPNCAAEIAAVAEKCDACGATFSGDGWKPIDSVAAATQPPAWTRTGKPLLVNAILVVTMLILLSNVAALNGISIAAKNHVSLPALGSLLACLLVIGASIWMFVLLRSNKLRSTLGISLYLWAMLLAYPVSNLLRSEGLLLPLAPLADTELAGAAFFEITRYGSLLTLIVWVALSREVRQWQFNGSNS